LFSHSLLALGWDERLSALTAELPLDHVAGRVTRADRGQCWVATADGTYHPYVQEPVAAGDWVVLAPNGQRITEVLPRRSALTRRGAGRATTAQSLAANIDHVLLVHGLDRAVNVRRLERELVVAWDSGAVPIVVLTKADLCADPSAEVAAAEAVALGVDVLAVSATGGDGLDQLHGALGPGRTFVLLGASGTGKSTLVNALAGAEWQATGEVRAGDLRGRHTTTAGELLVLPGGAILVDTPGIRAVGLWGGDDEDGMAVTFADIDELAAACRFADCAHDREPGCAVRDGVDEARLASWHRLRRELARTAGDRAGWERAEANKQLRAQFRSRRGPSRFPRRSTPGTS
jgi:ribosome biogenesis GTPase